MSSYKNLEALVEKYVHKYEALSLVLESVQQERDEYRDLYSSSQEKLEASERERDELRAEQAEHDEQIARMESKFSLAKRALDSKTARCEKAEAELRRRDAAAGEPVAYRYRATNMFGDLLDAWKLSETKNKTGTCQPLYTDAPPAVVPTAMTYAEALKVCDWENDQASIWVEGANWMRQQCLELGAQQQKVVELPAPEKDGGTDWQGDITAGCVNRMRDRIITALDSAGVKWELKK